MARPIKPGIDYFPLDVVLDTKFELIEAEFQLNGFAIVVKLFQKIYGGQGYYCEWNDEVALLFARKNGVGVNVVSEILRAALRRGIFDKELFEKYQILTSKGIQERYIKAKRCNSSKINQEYLLLNVPKNDINETKTPINATETEVNTTETPINKSKVNKSKVEYSITASADTVSRTDVQRVMEKWNELESYGIKAIMKTNSNSKRYSSVSARLKENGIDTVINAIERIKQSKFLQGNNKDGWTITFDWFIKPANFQKVAEGNYDDNNKQKFDYPKNNAFNNYDQRIYTEEEIKEIIRRKNGR